jgi:hypothetical protein
MDTLAVIHELKTSLWNLTYSYWQTETLFSIKWWSLLAINGIGYAIWWKLIDKQRLSQLLLFGSFVAVGRIVLDIVGTNTVLWSYDVREIPFFPSPFVHDFTVTPLSLMIVYQYSPSWKRFLAWTTVVTGVISFGFFPLLEVTGFLKLYNWNYFYSFILVIILAVLARAVMLGILRMEQKYQYGGAAASAISPTCQPALKPLDKEDPGDNE